MLVKTTRLRLNHESRHRVEVVQRAVSVSDGRRGLDTEMRKRRGLRNRFFHCKV